MDAPLYERARITSATPGTRILIEHGHDCPTTANPASRCGCDVRVRIVRPALALTSKRIKSRLTITSTAVTP